MFAPGRNIAIKAPAHEYAALVAFYRDTLGLKVLKAEADTTMFDFGALRLWVDRMPALAQAEIWLEVSAADPAAAAEHLAAHGVVRADAVEPLPEGFAGFWVIAPGGLVHLVSGAAQAAGSASSPAA
jgi:catechol 2,3-dioxygenase-like lactoylglutathione lyase family enzyme